MKILINGILHTYNTRVKKENLYHLATALNSDRFVLTVDKTPYAINSIFFGDIHAIISHLFNRTTPSMKQTFGITSIEDYRFLFENNDSVKEIYDKIIYYLIYGRPEHYVRTAFGHINLIELNAMHENEYLPIKTARK